MGNEDRWQHGHNVEARGDAIKGGGLTRLYRLSRCTRIEPATQDPAMRFALTAVALLASAWLAACDEAPATSAAPAAAADDANAALKSGAKNECAEVTNYLPEKLAAMTPELRALTEREYNLCISKVGSGS